MARPRQKKETVQDDRNTSKTANICGNIIYSALVRYQIKEEKSREKTREKSSLQRKMEHENGGGDKDV